MPPSRRSTPRANVCVPGALMLANQLIALIGSASGATGSMWTSARMHVAASTRPPDDWTYQGRSAA